MKNEKIIIAGFGGQGIISLGYIIAYAGMFDGLYVSHIPSYGAEMRGGTANCSVIVSSEEIPSPVIDEPSTIIVMNQASLIKFESKVAKDGKLLLNSDTIDKKPTRTDIKIISVPANKGAENLGSLKAANIFMGGVFVSASKIVNPESFKKAIKKYFQSKSNKIIEINLNAFDKGLEMGNSIV